jgi:hypothetical protein
MAMYPGPALRHPVLHRFMVRNQMLAAQSAAPRVAELVRAHPL